MKLIRLFLIISIIVFANVTPAFATYHQGDAVYRDPAYQWWHAAISETPNIQNPGDLVIQAGGLGTLVDTATWTTFLGNGTFVNPAQYKYGMTYDDSQKVLNMARYFALSRDIPYTLYYLMEYNGYSGSYIYRENVSKLRCDGLVEYCYEWYNFPVQTDVNGNWDISNINSVNYHQIAYGMSPITQWTAMDPHY